MVRWATLLKVLLLVWPLSALAVEPGCRLAVLGDSLTAGYGVDAADAFPARLKEALRKAGQPCEVLDAGVSGDTTAGGLARLDWVLGDKPTHLLIELGGNDALRALPVEQLRANLGCCGPEKPRTGLHVMLAGMLAPPNLGPDYGSAFAQAFASVATEHRVPLYPFFLAGVEGGRNGCRRMGSIPTPLVSKRSSRRLDPGRR